MFRHRRLWASFVLALATSFPLRVYADAPAKAAATTIDDDAADKEIEKLYVEGKYDAAFERAEKLVADRETRLGKEHPRTASAISDLGAMHLAKGNVTAAEPLLKRAVEILEKAAGSENTLATALSNLASVYLKKGDTKRATESLERAITLEEKAGTSRESERGALLAKLATVYMKSGNLRESEKLFLQAIAIHEKRNAERELFVDLSNIGALYRGMGRYDKAADAFNRAVPLAKRLYGEKHPDVGKLYHSIAVFLTGQLMATRNEKQLADTNRYFQQSIEILTDALGPDHPELAKVYSDWALMLTRTGSVEKALELRDKAQLIEEKWICQALASGSEEDKLAYATQLERSIDRVVSFQTWAGPSRKEITRFILRTILRNKAQALEATAASTSALRERMTPENKKRFDELVRVRGELASRYTRGPRGQTVTEFQTEIDVLTRKAEAIDAEISKESAAYRRSTKQVTVESVAERIPEDAALVELVRYHFEDPHFYSAYSERSKPPMYMAYVLRHDGQVLQIQLPVPAEAIDEKVAKIRKGLQDPDDKKVFRELSLLHDIIFVRLWEHLPHVKHLLISPDGDLSLVPFGALLDRDGHFLAEKYNITYLSSGRDVLRFGENDRPSSTATLVANPDYDAPGESGQTPLPARFVADIGPREVFASARNGRGSRVHSTHRARPARQIATNCDGDCIEAARGAENIACRHARVFLGRYRESRKRQSWSRARGATESAPDGKSFRRRKRTKNRNRQSDVSLGFGARGSQCTQRASRRRYIDGL